MDHIKRLLSILIVGFMLTGMVSSAFAETESTSSLSPKKVVAMLYDDSGSMHSGDNTNWFYADYALQLFTGLLNPGDDMMLTFMSNPEKIIKSNSNGLLKEFSTDRQKTVDAIREYKGDGNTPFDAIDNVGKALSSVEEEKASTQYWFVIIADGSFEKEPGNSDPKKAATTQELDEKLSKYAGKTMPNGSECHVLFMAIEGKAAKGEEEFKIAVPTETEYVQVKHCDGQKIVDVMAEMADTITGRYRVDKADISVNGNEIRMSSKVPLLNIQVLAQNSDAKVNSAKASEGDKLQSASISMSTPKGDSSRKEGKELHGTLSTITSKGDYISAGDYTLTLDKEITSDDIVVMYEVALETRLRITRNGKLVKDTSTLREKEKIDIKADLVILGTDESVDVTKLPNTVFEGMSLGVNENGTISVSETLGKGKSSIEYKDYVIEKGETIITARTDLRGFAPLITRETFIAKDPVVYGITSDDNELVVSRGYINGKKGSVDFTITGDGQPLSKKDIESLIDKKSISVTHNDDKTGVKFRYEITDDGKVRVYPKASILSNAFGFFSIPKGEYDVTVSIEDDTYATGSFRVKGYPLIGYIISLIILALAILLLYLIKKPHFPNGIMYGRKVKVTDRGLTISHSFEKKVGFMTDFFRLFGSRRTALEDGMVLYADMAGKMYMSSDWMKAHIIDQDDGTSGSDEYCMVEMNKPGPGRTIIDCIEDAFSPPLYLTRTKGDRDKNRQFNTGRALGVDDSPSSSEFVSFSTYYFSK